MGTERLDIDDMFPSRFTIDEFGLDALKYLLLDGHKGETVLISVELEKQVAPPKEKLND